MSNHFNEPWPNDYGEVGLLNFCQQCLAWLPRIGGSQMKPKNIVAVFIILMSVFPLAAQGQENLMPEREQKILSFFRNLESGTNPDYAVVKVGPTGIPNPTIIVYGYSSNSDVCQEIINLFNPTEKGAFAGTYYCKALP